MTNEQQEVRSEGSATTHGANRCAETDGAAALVRQGLEFQKAIRERGAKMRQLSDEDTKLRAR